jgi:hypothetical protein
VGNSVETGYFENPEGYGSLKLRYILGKFVLEMSVG